MFGIRNEELPGYEIIFKQDEKEIRKYQSHIVAKTIVSGTFEEAQSKGFRILAAYIFGKNKSKEKIAMTSPVLQSSESLSESIEMTAPVVISPISKVNSSTNQSWTMTFSMPSKYNLESLPTPDDDRVEIVEIESRMVAATTFSGF